MVDRPAAEAARIAAGSDPEHYDRVEIALHWTTAAFVVVLWLLGQGWGFLPRGSDGRHALQDLHVSLGLLFTAVLAARILWRIGPGRRPLPAGSGIAEAAAKLVHYALYVLLAAQIVLGWLWRWANHDPLSLFGLPAIPTPVAFTKTQQHLFGNLHGTIANVILILAGLHAAAALFHHFALRDGVLRRMLPAGRAGR